MAIIFPKSTICRHCRKRRIVPDHSYCAKCRAASERARRYIDRTYHAPPNPKPRPFNTFVCPSCKLTLPLPARTVKHRVCKNCLAISKARPPKAPGRPPKPIDPLTQEFIDEMKPED